MKIKSAFLLWWDACSPMMASEVASLGLELNWQKTKVQALGSREDLPSSITVLGQKVAMVEEFVYLGSLVHSTTKAHLISHIANCNAITLVRCGYAQSEDWKSRISISTKLKLYNTCILPIFLYGCACSAVTEKKFLSKDFRSMEFAKALRNQMVPKDPVSLSK